jgi:two-component system, cell cycle sensor histidine kinase and response regulator CckA
MKRTQTILLVENEPISRRFMSSMLKDNGYFVLEASSGKAALELNSRHRGPIHILVTDIILSGPMDGIELSMEIRRMRPDLRSVYISGYPSDTAEKLGLETEAEYFLSKPFSPKHFLGMMEDCMAQPTAGPIIGRSF